jgi:hypothetical protein
MEKKPLLAILVGLLISIAPLAMANPLQTCLPESKDPFCLSQMFYQTTPGSYVKYVQFLRCKDEPTSPYCTSTQTIICGWLLYGEKYDVSYCKVYKQVDSDWVEVVKLKPGEIYRIPASSGVNWKYEGIVEATVTTTGGGATQPTISPSLQDLIIKLLIIGGAAVLIVKGLGIKL